MVKSICSLVCVLAIIVAGAIYENNFIIRQFNEFEVVAGELYEKTENKTAVKDDALAVQENWLDKKKYLHNFIPHTEIKEMDLWISESVTLIGEKKWEDALSKVEVIKELAEQIPKTFEIRLENIF